MRWITSAALLFSAFSIALAAPVPKSPAPKEEKIDTTKLIGKWKPKIPNDHEAFEFADGAKVTRSLQAGGLNLVDATFYSVKDGLLVVGERPNVYVIVKLTDTEFELQHKGPTKDRLLTLIKDK